MTSTKDGRQMAAGDAFLLFWSHSPTPRASVLRTTGEIRGALLLDGPCAVDGVPIT